VNERRRVFFFALLGALVLSGCGGRGKKAYPELASPDPAVRAEAAARLGEEKDREAVPALIEVLSDPEETVRVEAARALGEIGDPSAIRALGRLADDPLDTVRLAAGQAFGKIADPAALPALERLLADPDTPVRKVAIKSLGKIPGAEAVRLLANAAAQDEAEDARQLALRTLADKDRAQAIPVLERALESESDLLRATAAHLLLEMGDRSSLPLLLKALEDPFFKVRSLAAHAAAKVAPSDPAVRDALARRLESEPEGLTRVDLAWALAKAGDRSKMGLIREALLRGDPPEVRAEAAMALGEIGEPSDRQLLSVAAKDRKGLVRREAKEALEKLGKTGAPTGEKTEARPPGGTAPAGLEP
jgi:HEAT repeat protein